MKVGIMQPYFMPYLGYWQLMSAVDTYVVYDDVQYIKRGWINRNNILLNGKKYLFTIKQSGASQNKLIKDVSFADDFVKFKKTLFFCYSKAPFYTQIMDLLENILMYEDKSIGNFILNSFSIVSSYIGFETDFVLSSEIKKDNSLKGKDKILAICKDLNAVEYYNAIGGQGLYDSTEFKQYGIDLKFVKSNLTPYKQFNNDFVPGLSIIDVLMFNERGKVKDMLKDFYTI
ncbi:MAG: WbqC family protein [Bacteroidales bacterium]|nr:WbqC family protein [Bacteroidales bacterium]